MFARLLQESMLVLTVLLLHGVICRAGHREARVLNRLPVIRPFIERIIGFLDFNGALMSELCFVECVCRVSAIRPGRWPLTIAIAAAG
jgi:hypothetical protein